MLLFRASLLANLIATVFDMLMEKNVSVSHLMSDLFNDNNQQVGIAWYLKETSPSPNPLYLEIGPKIQRFSGEPGWRFTQRAVYLKLERGYSRTRSNNSRLVINVIATRYFEDSPVPRRSKLVASLEASINGTAKEGFWLLEFLLCSVKRG